MSVSGPHNSLSATNKSKPHHGLAVHFLIICLLLQHALWTHLGLDFGDSGASSNTLNPDENIGSSGGKELTGDQGSSQHTKGPVNDLPPSHGSSDTRSSVQDTNNDPRAVNPHRSHLEVPSFRRRQRLLYSNYCRQGSTGPSFIDGTPTPTFSFNQ